MKKILLCLIALTMSAVIEAQTITNDKLDGLVSLGNGSWTKRAKEISENNPLNNGILRIVEIIPCEVEKEKAYERVRRWAVEEFGASAFSEEKEGFSFVGRLSNICHRSIGDNKYVFSIQPTLRFDFKDGKIRYIFTLRGYDVVKTTDDGGLIVMMGNIGVPTGGTSKKTQTWSIGDCAPYSDNSKHAKVASSKAYVYSIACWRLILNRVKEVIYEKTNEISDDW